MDSVSADPLTFAGGGNVPYSSNEGDGGKRRVNATIGARSVDAVGEHFAPSSTRLPRPNGNLNVPGDR